MNNNTHWIIYFQAKFMVATLLESHRNYDVFELVETKTPQKLKALHKIYAIDVTNIDQFVVELNQLIPQIDTTLLAEMVDYGTDYTIAQLSDWYFGDNYSCLQKTALIFALNTDKINFLNLENGSFNKNDPETRARKIEMIEQLKLQQQQIDKYYNVLIEFKNPNFTKDITRVFNKANRSSAEYKSLSLAAKNLNLSPLELATKCGLISDITQMWIDNFIEENFSGKIEYAQPQEINLSHIPLNTAITTFSIDDENTTEIDDAFSIQYLANNHIIVGIHIAAPALDSNLTDTACRNISTIYYPNNKLTMFDTATIEKYSLIQGKQLPVVSIYFTLDEKFEILEYDSKLEQVIITKNLRNELLENAVSEEQKVNFNCEFDRELNLLYKFAQNLEKKRGRASVNNLVPEYNFSFDNNQINIKVRIRGTPIDLIVSELMILANSTWGRMLTNAFIPAIYRSKMRNFAVKMTTTPGSHSSLNVDYYTWSTSPLRRSSDFVNQHQIISLITDRKHYYRKGNPILENLCSVFDSKYAKYIDFQNKLERYYAIKYLIQENITILDATFIYAATVQLDRVPISINLESKINENKPKGSVIKLKIYNLNPINLHFDYEIVLN